jgi:hypothetical protein
MPGVTASEVAERVDRRSNEARRAAAAAASALSRPFGEIVLNPIFHLLVGVSRSRRTPPRGRAAGELIGELVRAAPSNDEEIALGIAAWRAALASGRSGIGRWRNRVRAWLNNAFGGLFTLGLPALVLLTADLERMPSNARTSRYILMAGAVCLGLWFVARIGRIANRARYWGEAIDVVASVARPIGTGRVVGGRLVVWIAGPVVLVFGAVVTMLLSAALMPVTGLGSGSYGYWGLSDRAALYLLNGAANGAIWLVSEVHSLKLNAANLLAEIAAWRASCWEFGASAGPAKSRASAPTAPAPPSAA